MTNTTKPDDDKLQVASDITRPQQINNNNSLALEWAELVNSLNSYMEIMSLDRATVTQQLPHLHTHDHIEHQV